MTDKTECTLIIDARERSVTRHEKELENITMQVKQITIGDYAILSPLGNILAIIERKSLVDFAASLKDGRANNKSKLTALRDHCGCRIIYIIEGPAFPGPTECFGNVPYRYIESSIFHLMIRDQIMVIRTKDTLDTAKMFYRLVKSMDTLCNKMEEPDGEFNKVTAIPIEDIVSNISSITEGGIENATNLLTVKHEKSIHDIVREMWSVFPGIATETASDFIKKWTIADIVARKVPIGDIQNHKINGRTVNKKVINSLTDINIFIQKKLLRVVPGISANIASAIIDSVSLPNLLTYSKESISIIGIGKPLKSGGRKKLGMVLAERILQLMNYKYEQNTNTNKPVPPGDEIPNVGVDDPDIKALLDHLN